jgi:hypothetical protein
VCVSGHAAAALSHAQVYRFPDLLKRWDDVDGERGTWYERMKRRCTRESAFTAMFILEV